MQTHTQLQDSVNGLHDPTEVAKALRLLYTASMRAIAWQQRAYSLSPIRTREAYFAALGAGADFAAGVLNCTVSATSLPSLGSLA